MQRSAFALEPASSTGFKFNLLANFAGTGWSALMQVICIPLYIKFMGIESYGLIGFYVMMQAVLQVLDLGLSPTVNREMARYSVQPQKIDEARDLVSTLEIIYWIVGVLIGAMLVAASGWLSDHWIHANSMSSRTETRALMLMGILSFFQWPVSFYQGGLMGLHRQVQYNGIRIATVTLNTMGGILILWLVSPTITAFLTWQTIVNAIQLLVLMAALWRSLRPATRKPRPDLSLLRSIRAFALGMSGITLLGLIVTQLDKIIVSKLLPLTSFGYYSLAWAVASGLLVIAGSVFGVIFPRMSAQVAVGDSYGLRRSYHVGSQLMAVLVLPLAAVLSVFSNDVLCLWTRNLETASRTAPILGTLAIGSAVNALLYLPYSVQLACGWTKLNLATGLLSLLLAVPLIIVLTKRFGPVGAATVWAGLNLLNLMISVPIMHRRLLRHEAWKYYSDFGFPLLGAFGAALLARVIFSSTNSMGIRSLTISMVWIAAVVSAVSISSDIRSRAIAEFADMRLYFARRRGSLS